MDSRKTAYNSIVRMMLRSIALFIFIAIPFEANSQTQKHLTTMADKDIIAEFSCADARRVSFYADKYNYNYNNSGITSFLSPKDKYKANIIAPDRVWGNASVYYKIGIGDWIPVYDGETKAEIVSEKKIVYTDYEKGMPVKMERVIEKKGRGLDVTIKLQTMMDYPVTIGRFEIPFPTPGPPGEGYDPTGRRYDHDRIYEQTFIRHKYIAGDASYLYFTRRSGEPPFLLAMTKPGTSIEYFDNSSVFIHSAMAHEDGVRSRAGNTSLVLSPAGKEGSEVEYGYRLEWVDSYEEMREVLYENGLFDIRVAPGMTLPRDLTARVALRTKNTIDSITAEYPSQTTIRELPHNNPEYRIYEVGFRRLGENLLNIHYNGGEKTILEFFSTEPLETLIRKRSSFITRKQQIRDSAKWYDGLFSQWDMSNTTLRSPDDTDGFDYFYGFFIAGDDPALGKAPYVAAKNVFFPDDYEISSVEYYIENFVWGGLQRTDQELPNPYGIYSVPNWYVARDHKLFAGIRNNNLDKMNICRNYDYPHIIMMYYHMFQIAEYYPDKVKYLDAEGYLERAYQTAKALYTYPYEIYPWEDTYKWGLMNELVVLPLIQDLERYGRMQEAGFLRDEWEKKVKYFVYDDKYPFHSEYSTGSTAMESGYAFAKYGTLHEMKPDTNLWYDTNLKKWWSHPEVKQEDSRQFMDRLLSANMAIRGYLIPAYYNLGTTDRLCYRSRMGGLGILDFGLEFAGKPWDWLQAGYASYLGSFALINSGTAESNYGYWYPGIENDGAMGWTFNAGRERTAFSFGKERTIPHGSYPYDGEGDLSNCAIFRMAETILTDDPVFGWISYGGELEQSSTGFSVIPKDGVRSRFSVITENNRISIDFPRDGFLKDEPVLVDKSLGKIKFKIENRSGDRHITRIEISTKTDSFLEFSLDGKNLKPEKISKGKFIVNLDIINQSHEAEILYSPVKD